MCRRDSNSARSSSGRAFTILEGLLEQPLRPTVAEAGGRENLIGIGRVESPRGDDELHRRMPGRPD